MPEQRLFAEIEQQLSALLRRARSTSMTLARRVHPDLDASGYALLAQVDSQPAGVRASDVVLALGLDKSTVSRDLRNLEHLGLIERVPDPADGRARLVRLTETGAKRFGAIRAQRRAEFEAILARWDRQDLADLARLLTRLNTDFS